MDGVHSAAVHGTQAHQCHTYANQPFEHLLAHVSPAAYASQQEGDAPKCHPNTRVAVIDEIYNWILRVIFELQWILWVCGAAGAGKSAIARSMVDKCLSNDVVIARFFFFRADPTRNTLDHVVATLAFQLMQSIQDLEPLILVQLRRNPLLFKESLEAQLQALIVGPLRQLQRESTLLRDMVLLFDGVDECGSSSHQSMLIQTIFQLFHAQQLPIRVLFFSRPEVHIKNEFWVPEIQRDTHQLMLDSKYLPDADIRRFLIDSFAQIKATHPDRAHIHDTWPSRDDIEEIIQKSSGQFIYASVAIKFISDPLQFPEAQLEVILGLKPVGRHTPFAQLDALYRHIFSQVSDMQTVTLVLGCKIFASFFIEVVDEIPHLFDTLTFHDIRTAFSKLSSITEVFQGTYEWENDVIFFHASLGDFLTDSSRSREFFIDQEDWETRIFTQWSHKLTVPDLQHGRWIYSYVADRLKRNVAIRKALLELDPPWVTATVPGWRSPWVNYLNCLKRIDFEDDGKIYQHNLYITARTLRRNNLWSVQWVRRMRTNHDLTMALARLDREEADGRVPVVEPHPASVDGHLRPEETSVPPPRLLDGQKTTPHGESQTTQRSQSPFRAMVKSLKSVFKKRHHE